MIQFENVSKVYRKKYHSVHDLNFSIQRGEFVSIIGPSGSGKTTLLRLLLAEEKPTEGKIFFDGVDIHRLKKSHIPKFRQKIGVVFQDLRLIQDKTSYENIAFAMEMLGKDEASIRADVPHVLKLVGLEDKMFHFPIDLSGGEQQRLAIARAIINQPELLIVDEPTNSLDHHNAERILSIFRKIHQFGTTIILSTHNRDIVDAVKQRVLVMHDGRIVKDIKKGKYHIQKHTKK